MSLSFIVLFSTLVAANMPKFCNSPTCDLLLDSYDQEQLYVHVPQGQKVSLKVTNGIASDVAVASSTPLLYTAKQAVKLCASALKGYTGVTSYREYLQVAEYHLLDTQCKSATKATVTTYDFESGANAFDGVNVLLKFGVMQKTDVMEIVGMPISQFNTHGFYWAQQQYYYVYVAVYAGLALLYIVLSRCRLWQMFLVFAMAAFAAVWSENLYQSVFASRRAGSQGEVAYTVLCVVTLANLIPFIFCMLFMRYGKCRPIPWSVFGLMIGTGFLFLAGAGWFVGPGCIILASLIRLTQRTALNVTIN